PDASRTRRERPARRAPVEGTCASYSWQRLQLCTTTFLGSGHAAQRSFATGHLRSWGDSANDRRCSASIATTQEGGSWFACRLAAAGRRQPYELRHDDRGVEESEQCAEQAQGR